MDRPKIVSRRELPIGQARSGHVEEFGRSVRISEGWSYECSHEEFMRVLDGPPGRLARFFDKIFAHELPTTGDLPPVPSKFRGRDSRKRGATAAKRRGWWVVK